jgi:hypothetical protein
MLTGYGMDHPRDDAWSGNDHVGIRAFREFIYDLWQEGYLHTPSLMPIINNVDRHNVNQYGEVDVRGNYHGVRRPSQHRPSNVPDIFATPCKILFSMALRVHALTFGFSDGTNFRLQNSSPLNSAWFADYDFDIPMPNRMPLPQGPPPSPPSPPPSRASEGEVEVEGKSN